MKKYNIHLHKSWIPKIDVIVSLCDTAGATIKAVMPEYGIISIETDLDPEMFHMKSVSFIEEAKIIYDTDPHVYRGPIEQAYDGNELPTVGKKVRIADSIRPKESCSYFFVNPKHLDSRRPSEEAVYAGWVPGAGGDVWWIEHQDKTIGAYEFSEILKVIEPNS